VILSSFVAIAAQIVVVAGRLEPRKISRDGISAGASSSSLFVRKPNPAFLPPVHKNAASRIDFRRHFVP
jgi:hypothetical protein